jgi:acetolactate synthase-1/2/3 large subunit
MAETLAERGVDYVFGLPGGEIVAFIDACRRAGLRFLLTGHEASAAWMAQVVGQITGVPGVCASTLGPGASNLVTGVANAWLDRAPMIAVTAQIPQSRIATMTHQRLALEDMFSPITKGSFAVGRGHTGDLIDHAMELAGAPRPGPVHVSLASDLAIEECNAHGASTDARRTSVIDEDAAGRIVDRLQTARRPLALIGLGTTPGMAASVRSFIDGLQLPVVVTPKAKGIVAEDYPLFLGVASGMAIDGDVVETIRSADLVLSIGFDPVECDKTWFADIDIAAVDSVSMAEGDYHPLEAIGDMQAILTFLRAECPAVKPWPADVLAARRKAMERAAMGFSPLRVIEELRSVFPRGGITTCDVGSHKLLMGQFWRVYEPGTFLMSNGLSGMGFGVPAAVAAKLARPDQPVLAVVGDGGMLMMLHDLALIRELGLPVIIVVLTDGSLSLIRVSAERRGFPAYGVDFMPPDFAAIARAFGIRGERAESVEDVRNSVERALTDNVPLVLDVRVDYREYYDLV